jgi:hypothetical protein
MALHQHDRVVIASHAYTTTGTIEEIRPVHELMDLSVHGAPPVQDVMSAMHDLDIQLIALIRYQLNGKDVVFWALQLHDDSWRDLKGQRLVVAPVI